MHSSDPRALKSISNPVAMNSRQPQAAVISRGALYMLKLRRNLKFDPPKRMRSPDRWSLGTFNYYASRRVESYSLSSRVPFAIGGDNMMMCMDYFFDACYCLDRID